MAEHEREGEELISTGVTKRKSLQEDDTASKKLKVAGSTTNDGEPCLDAASSRTAASVVLSSACGVGGSEATGDAAASDNERGENAEQGQVPKLSKRQMKKLKKKELYKAGLALRRAKEKEKQKQKKREAKLNNVVLGPSRKELKRSTMANSNCKVRVAVDMSFDHLMNEKDLGKCIKQLLRCYSANRRASNPLQLYVTSFDGETKAAMEKNTGYDNWDVHFQAESYLDLFDHKDVVYLTSESENVLHEVCDDKVYIIGGLVDHNSQKGLTLDIAEEKGIQHAQLPIEEFLDMKTRKVLSIVHVFEILLFVSEGMSWKDALLSVMPARKGAAEKSSTHRVGDEFEDSSSQDVDHTEVDEGSVDAAVTSATL